MKKTIYITSCHALISRNILSSGLLEMLKRDGFQAVIIVPEAKVETFVKNFGAPYVVIKGVSIKNKKREAFFKYLSLASLNTKTLSIKRATEMNGSGKLVKYFLSNSFAHSIIRLLERWTYTDRLLKDIFEEYPPSCVFSTDIQNEIDLAMLTEAKKKGVYTVAMVRSWDNLTSKGLIRVIPEKLLVWNEIVKNEAINLNQIKESIITKVGISHYDAYNSYDYSNKKEFFDKIGGDINKKLVTVIPIGDRYLKNNTVDRDIIKILCETLPLDFQILVRMPPGDYVREIENNPNQFKRIKVLYDRAKNTAQNVKLTEMVKEDDEHFAKIIYFSDLVVSGPSTAVIDAAYINRPIVLFGFDGYEKREYLDSIIKYYDYDNFLPIIKSGGALFARNQEDFKKYLKEYLENPKKDYEKRKKLALLEVEFLDGKCTERLYTAVSGIIKNNK